MKRLLSMLLILALLLGCAPAVLAADDAKAAADRLYSLGLFNGTRRGANGDPVYELERVPTRAEALTMLVRLLGVEPEVLSKDWTCPFHDVPDWAQPYVGYAWEKGLAKGYDAVTFGSSDPASAAMYLTFVLRALGYQDGVDFQWDRAWELSDEVAVTFGEYGPDSVFTRGDAVLVSVSALDTLPKGGVITLLEQLRERGAIHERNEDYRTLVSEALHAEGLIRGGWKDISRSISVPTINMKSADAKRVNKELEGLWNSAWNPDLLNDENDAPLQVDYEWCVAGSFLSLVVHVVDTWENDSDRVYLLTLDGTRAEAGDLLGSYGLTAEDLLPRCLETVRSTFDKTIAGMDSPLMLNQLISCRDTYLNGSLKLSPEDLTPYLCPDGSIGCVIKMMWPAGSGTKVAQADGLLTQAQAKAIQLYRQMESEGGYSALLTEAKNMAALGEASVYAYRRIYAREAGTKLAYSFGKILAGDTSDIWELGKSFVEDQLKELSTGGKTPSVNDVMYLLLAMSTAELPDSFAVAHKGFDPGTVSDKDARIYLERYYATRIDFLTTLMTYYYFFDQNAKNLGDYALDLLKLLRDDLWEKTTLGTVQSYLSSTKEKRTELAAAETLLDALEAAAEGRPAALLTLAQQSDISQVKAWSSLVRNLLSEKALALGKNVTYPGSGGRSF